MTHGERFNSTIALSYKPSNAQPKSKTECTQRYITCDSDFQIWVHLRHLQTLKFGGGNPLIPESWDVQVQLIS